MSGEIGPLKLVEVGVSGSRHLSLKKEDYGLRREDCIAYIPGSHVLESLEEQVEQTVPETQNGCIYFNFPILS